MTCPSCGGQFCQSGSLRVGFSNEGENSQSRSRSHPVAHAGTAWALAISRGTELNGEWATMVPREDVGYVALTARGVSGCTVTLLSRASGAHRPAK